MERNNETLIVIISVLILLILFSGFGMMGFGSFGMGTMMNWMFGSNFGFMWIFGIIFWTIIFVALALFILWISRQLKNSRRR